MSLQKTSVKGYLRAGKILQLMGKWGIALETYRYGLKQILSDDNEGKRVCTARYSGGDNAQMEC